MKGIIPSTVTQSRIRHKLALLSVTFSALQVIVVWGAVMYRTSLGHDRASAIAGTGWILGTCGALLTAVASLCLDTARIFGFLALILALLVFVACGIPMIV
jgi:hypothetical protein